jgi:hypothetical protein
MSPTFDSFQASLSELCENLSVLCDKYSSTQSMREQSTQSSRSKAQVKSAQAKCLMKMRAVPLDRIRDQSSRDRRQ